MTKRSKATGSQSNALTITSLTANRRGICEQQEFSTHTRFHSPTMKAVAVCLEKRSLLAEYNACVQEYAAATAELIRDRKMGAFAKLVAQADGFRLRCEEARRKLKKHVDDHAC